MKRFASVAIQAMNKGISEDDKLSMIAVIDDALMTIYDNNPQYYEYIINRIKQFT